MENKFDYKNLSQEEQVEYNKVAEQMFGKTNMHCETGEPMYIDEAGNLNQIHQFVLDRMELNKNMN